MWDKKEKNLSDPENYLRKSDGIQPFIKTASALNKTGFKITFFGNFSKNDKRIFEQSLKQKNVNLNTQKNSKEKKEILALSKKCDLFIGAPGGGFMLGLFARKKIMVDSYPFGLNLPGVSHLYKKLYHQEKNVPHEKAKKKFFFNYNLPKPFTIKNNSADEIYKFVIQNALKWILLQRYDPFMTDRLGMR